MQELYIDYGPLAVAAVLSALAWLYYKFLAQRLQSSLVAQMVLDFAQEVRAVITEVNATYVRALKYAGEDGVWTDKEKAVAKQMAINKLKENWGPTGIKRLTKVLGIGGYVDSWLGTQVEATLADMKREVREIRPGALALPPKPSALQ